MFKLPIAIGLSPNTQNDDIRQAVKIIFQPWMWKSGNSIKKVEAWFKSYLDTGEVFLFNSGRSALYAVLKSFGIGEGDEVLVQAFTCVAVPAPVIWIGATPVFVDIDETLNMDPVPLEKHINDKTKAIIIQHTFGIPAKIEMIKKIARKYNLILIEDCAHSLGAEIDGRKVGTLGDVAIFSFGRDKVISSVFGGAAIISAKRKAQSAKLRKFREELAFPGYFWILQQLLHPIAFGVILPLYNLGLGKIVLYLLQKLRLLTFPVYRQEKEGGMPSDFPARYPNALASLLVIQLNKLAKYNKKRIQTADYYYKNLAERKDITLPPKVDGSIYLRFNILTDRGDKIVANAKKHKVILGNWYRNVIDPIGVNYEKIGYETDSCLKAQKAASLSVNLPTYPRLTTHDLETIINVIKTETAQKYGH